MNAELGKHLWRSPELRTALKKEVSRLTIFVVVYIGAVAVSRYIREMPVLEGLFSAALGAAAVVLLWFVSAVRTLRAVLREQNLLQR